MKPIGYLPAVPAFWKFLKASDQVAVKIIVRELENRESKFPGGEFESKNSSGLNQASHRFAIQVKKRLQFALIEKVKSFLRVHGNLSTEGKRTEFA